jgi:hypothetical protein
MAYHILCYSVLDSLTAKYETSGFHSGVTEDSVTLGCGMALCVFVVSDISDDHR